MAPVLISSGFWKQGFNILLLLLIAFFITVGYWFLNDNNRRSEGSSLLNRFIPQAYADPVREDTVTSFYFPLVLCYHQIRDWKSSDTKKDRDYIMPVQQFREQMKLLHDNGYHTVLPDQWLDHLQHGTPLPEKPILLTFDDGTQSQYDNALPELDHYDYKAVFFIMTVTLGRPHFMSENEVRYLSDHGHLIGCHTWDHHDVRNYNEADWKIQLERSTQVLEQITGKPVQYFAYPYGSWDRAAVVRLKAHGYRMAFQLNGRGDPTAEDLTIRRILVDGNWNTAQFMKAITLPQPGRFSTR